MTSRDRVMTYQHRCRVTGHNTVGVTRVTRCSAVTGQGMGEHEKTSEAQSGIARVRAPSTPTIARSGSWHGFAPSSLRPLLPSPLVAGDLSTESAGWQPRTYRLDDSASVRRATHPRPIHAIRWEASPGDHRLSETCPCLPVACYDLAEPSRVVFVHRVASA